MDALKNISFSIAIFLIGAIFIVLGLSDGIKVASYSLSIQDTLARIISFSLGGAFVAIAIYLEIKVRPAGGRNAEKSATPKDVLEPKNLQAEDFFHTLDDRPAGGFPDMVKNAIRVQILGRTAVNLLSQYERLFEQLGKGGCEIQLLFVDPASEASKFLYGSNPEVYRSNIISASQHLKKLKGIIGNCLQVRVTRHAPTSSVIVVEKQDLQQGFVQVQLYFLHSAIGRDRPIFKVNRCDKWYGIFQNEFTQLWSDSVEWDVCSFSENASKGQH
jgi:hypothetical protein